MLLQQPHLRDRHEPRHRTDLSLLHVPVGEGDAVTGRRAGFWGRLSTSTDVVHPQGGGHGLQLQCKIRMSHERHTPTEIGDAPSMANIACPVVHRTLRPRRKRTATPPLRNWEKYRFRFLRAGRSGAVRSRRSSASLLRLHRCRKGISGRGRTGPPVCDGTLGNGDVVFSPALGSAHRARDNFDWATRNPAGAAARDWL